MLEWLEDKVAALEAEEDGSAPLSFDETASSTSEIFEPVRKPVFRRSLTGTSFLPSLNFHICCQPNAAPGFGLLGSSLRQSGALEKMLASQIAKRLDASRAASAQPKHSERKGED